METKHIIHFPTWIDLNRIYESQEGANGETYLLSRDEITNLKNNFTYDNLKEILVSLNKEIVGKISSITTRDVLDWFHTMYVLYDLCKGLGKFAGVVYGYIKKFITDYHKEIFKFFSGTNPELTQEDKAAAVRFKPLSAEETAFENSANAKLKSLGLIK